MIFKFDFKGKKIEMNVKECRNAFSKALGLMFRKKSKPLLFIFSKENRSSIHSFFCVKFFAIWFNKGKIIDVKLVKPWRTSIKPKERFDRLLEIPVNDKNFSNFI